MTRVASVVFTLSAAAMPASAGVITFDPDRILSGFRHDLVRTEITVQSPAATAILFTLDFDGGAIFAADFVFDSDFASQYFFAGVTELGDGTLQVEGFGFTPNDTVLVGSLTIDTGGLGPGEYHLVATGEAQQADQTSDFLEGAATVYPEPGTLIHLGVGAATCWRRRARGDAGSAFIDQEGLAR